MQDPVNAAMWENSKKQATKEEELQQVIDEYSKERDNFFQWFVIAFVWTVVAIAATGINAAYLFWGAPR